MGNNVLEVFKQFPHWHKLSNSEYNAMCKHMRQVAAENDNITVHIRYSQPRPEDVKGREYDSIGYVGVDLLKTLLPGKDMDFYLCGPPPFMNGLLKGIWSSSRLSVLLPASDLPRSSGRRRSRPVGSILPTSMASSGS